MSSKAPGCKARQYGDQLQCSDCALTWDMNDPDAPMCRKKVVGNDQLSEIRNVFNRPAPRSAELFPMRPMKIMDLPVHGVIPRLYSIDWPDIPSAKMLSVMPYSGYKGGTTYTFFAADGQIVLELIKYIFEEGVERRLTRGWSYGRPLHWV